MAPTDAKQRAAARDQSLFREVNERIAEVTAGSTPEAEPWDFLCECEDKDCTDTVSMKHDEYEAIRTISTHFLVRPGHVYATAERVVETGEGYVVVEKFGAAAPAAVRLDPRGRRARSGLT